ncbi:ParA family protein [Chondrinema litorale]|uniref:ParA family protein n=1 Tax=Chondrinema litorale TaxID=2994555 RepID=UPI002543BBC0|nr:ParA family protein [Chondrinema litorale]UZR98010.1 ParA family protein [Chondrinema litorale]
MSENDQIVQFLKANPAFSLSMLEKEASIPSGVLSKVLRGERKLNADHIKLLRPVLYKYGLRHDDTPSKAKVISIVNHKGGVGKTTTAINLGKALTMMGKKVLLVDMDSQGNLSQGLGFDEPEKQVVDALLKEEPLPIFLVSENYDLSPSDLELAEADLELVQNIGGFNRLNKVLRPIKDQYDFILIDCPPSLNIITSSAMVAADSCLITLQPEIAAVKGLDKILTRIGNIQEEINEKLRVEGIVFTLVNKRLVVHQSNMEYVRESLPGFKIFEAMIRENVSLTEAQSAQMDIFSYAPESNGAKDYYKLAEELLQN